MKKTITFALAAFCAASLFAGWKDQGKIGDNTLIVKQSSGESLRIDVLAENLLRVRKSVDGVWTESGMNRYGVLKRDWKEVKFSKSANAVSTDAAVLTVDANTGALQLKSLVSKADVAIVPRLEGKGYKVSFCKSV